MADSLCVYSGVVNLCGADLPSLSLEEGEACYRLRHYTAAADKADAGARFKNFVHEYLDAHGVPVGDAANEHQKQGCRIGARLDWLFTQVSAAEEVLREAGRLRDEAVAQLVRVRAQRDALADALRSLLYHWPAEGISLRDPRRASGAIDRMLASARAAIDACTGVS